MNEWTHYWRVRKQLPERYGHVCRVVARGKLNTCKVLFEDGTWHITSRWNVRRLKP